VDFEAGKRKNAGMFGREERQQNNRRKPEEKRDGLGWREGETMVIIVSLRQSNPLLSFGVQKKINTTPVRLKVEQMETFIQSLSRISIENTVQYFTILVFYCSFDSLKGELR